MRLQATRRWILTGFVVSMMLPAIPAMAAVDYFITFDGAKQGKIAENVQVLSVTHQAMAPMAGMASGKRMHSTIMITKKIDVASPKLFQALSTNESLKNVTLTFRGAGAGKAAQTVVLKDAMITNIRKAGGNEEITLSYDTAEVTWTDGGKTATDDWLVPK